MSMGLALRQRTASAPAASAVTGPPWPSSTATAAAPAPSAGRQTRALPSSEPLACTRARAAVLLPLCRRSLSWMGIP